MGLDSDRAYTQLYTLGVSVLSEEHMVAELFLKNSR